MKGSDIPESIKSQIPKRKAFDLFCKIFENQLLVELIYETSNIFEYMNFSNDFKNLCFFVYPKNVSQFISKANSIWSDFSCTFSDANGGLTRVSIDIEFFKD